MTRNLDNAPNATQVPDEPASQDQPLPETPSVFSRFFDPPASMSAQRPPMTIHLCHHRIRRTFQARLLQLKFNNDAAVLATNTAELTARIAELSQLTATAAEADARSSCTPNHQTDGSRITRNGPQGLTVTGTFELSQTQKQRRKPQPHPSPYRVFSIGRGR